ncbi:MAG: hypothetical protein KDC07_11545 [Chitinophagaceae bacterium]|nr:hypothetical protein [Chitinophagaceae bacterium]MCB9046147.1 hypothetical protein [Chitinophagales bacterium]
MKRLPAILILLLIACDASAHEDRFYFFLNMGCDYQLNNGDVVNNTYNTNALTISNTASSRIGLEFRGEVTHHFFMSAGMDYRIIPHKLNINYRADKAGFTNTNQAYTGAIAFTSHNIDPYIKFGHTIPVTKRAKIDISFGAIFSVPVNGKINDNSLVLLNITSDKYKDLAMYSNDTWGNKTPSLLPVKSLYTIQLAYRISPEKAGGKRYKAGIDFSGSASGSMNNATIKYYGANRSDVGNSSFADRFLSVGLFVALGI